MPRMNSHSADSSKDERNEASVDNVRQPERKDSLLARMLSSRRSANALDSPKPDIEDSRDREPSLPPLPALSLTGYKRNTKHRLMNDELAENIRGLLPARLQLFEDWELVYSLEQHGVSLNTLYQNCDLETQLRRHNKDKQGEGGFAESVVRSILDEPSKSFTPKRPHGYVMIIKDDKHSIFGCYVNQSFKPTDQKRYYGNGECFLWKCEKTGSKEKGSRFKAFVYTGINDNIIYSNHDFIAIGSSHGQNGLWIDKSLYNGVSYPCETFGNEVLNSLDPNTSFGKFKIIGLEVWRIGLLE
ncbi:uncharacterized protein PRCAT00005651001 [Priceomyces carsonii]|uniref:uncharacterized protein n=1 Tax=Priceomyces carsonii TaxID=28549 RepID=UPI002EDB1609|nr:unnamed protein product [Priceomyces carsonii]